MKKILLLAVVFCTLMVAQAQRVYFIYLQSDNSSPFYLKTGSKVYSSTAQGYLIVPKLVDSTYNVVIGKSGFSEARFTVPINGKDRGFLLRSAGSRLSLFDLQTLAVIEALNNNTSGDVSYIQKNDRFTTLLSMAADDTTLLQQALFTKTEKAPAPAPAVAKVTEPAIEATASTETAAEKDSQTIAVQTNTQTVTTDTTTIAKTENVVAAEKEPVKQQQAEADTTEAAATEPAPSIAKVPAADESIFKRSVVTRRAESSTSEGFGLVFTDSADGLVDTIRLVIPNPKVAYKTGSQDVVKEEKQFLDLPNEKPANETTSEKENKKETAKKRNSLFGKKDKEADEPVKEEAIAQNDEGREDNKDRSRVSKRSKEVKETKAQMAAPEEAVAKKATCENNASTSDFNRLRRNMVGKQNEGDMIAEAQKYFKNRCFTTLQIKTLSSLLLTSAGRYNFFEAAYNSISDKENFKSLQNELWDRADINRFKALLAK